MFAVGQTMSVRVEKPAAGGRMIARADGQVLLVSGAIPGEQVSVRVERVGRGVAYAETIAVDEPSPDRRPSARDPLCGGCLYSHIDYPRQLQIKALVIEDAFTRIGRVELSHRVDVAASPEDGYRMRARLHMKNGTPGFFREGTHVICPARDTRQLLPATCDATDRLVAGLRSLGMSDAGQLEIAENIDATERAIHLSTPVAVTRSALAGLASYEGITGLTVSSGERGGGGALVSGDPHVGDRIEIEGRTVTLRRHVQAFFQANRYLLSRLVAHVVGPIEPGDRVVDLYAGVGLFALASAEIRGASVVAVEGDRVGAVDLAENAAAVGHGHVEPVHQAVEAYVRHERVAPAVLIVDPPRTGMSKEAVEGAIGLGARTVTYVSCDVATLARDARRFVDAGYRIERVDGFDLFPNTPHVETVVRFARG
ncbi:MAG: class I SAM-dependent RNA methyltransferase [Vicinamibacterales bacterium]